MQYRILRPVKLSENSILQPGDLYDGFTPEDAAELLSCGSIKEENKPFASTPNGVAA